MTDPTPPLVPTEFVHIAGADIRIGDRLRQRCSWCGAVLIDQDLTRVAVMTRDDGTVPEYPTWPFGALLAHDGAAWWVMDPVPHPSGDGSHTIPDGSCMSLDPDLTGGPRG